MYNQRVVRARSQSETPSKGGLTFQILGASMFAQILYSAVKLVVCMLSI